MNNDIEIKKVNIILMCNNCKRERHISLLSASFMMDWLHKEISERKCYQCKTNLDISHINFEFVRGIPS